MKALLRSGFLALAIMVAPTVPANAGPYEDGVAAYERGDYVMALRLWRPLAEEGNVDAQLNLGVIYNEGQGVPQNYAEAVKWFRKAAEQGSASAQYSLGVMYSLGTGVPEDFIFAQMLFYIAAAQGHENAQKHQYEAARLITADQLAEAQRMAREWMAKHQQ